VQEDKDDAEDIKANEMRSALDKHKDDQPKIIENRINALETAIK